MPDYLEIFYNQFHVKVMFNKTFTRIRHEVICMENEYRILDTIEKNQEATQREISKHTGISLGSVNVIIKRLIKKGLVKIERLSPRTIRYILTPAGMKEKTRTTYKYIVNSYNYIRKINIKIDRVIVENTQEGLKSVVLFGSGDEIYTLLQKKLNTHNIPFVHIVSIKNLNNTCRNNKNGTRIILWEPEKAEQLEQRKIKHINLISAI